MSQFFTCPYLKSTVELTGERVQHINSTHPGTLPDYQEQIAATLMNPDQIRQSARDQNALLFSKRFDTIRTGRYLVVVIVSDNDSKRQWIITTYTARKLSGSEIIWQVEN